MRTHFWRGFGLAACLLSGLQAQAATVTIATDGFVDPSGVRVWGISTLMPSEDSAGWTQMIGASGGVVGGATLEAGAPSFPTIVSPVTSISYDDSTNALLGVGTQGGFMVTAVANDLLSMAGGSFNVTDLQISIQADHSALVYGAIHGVGGIGIPADFEGVIFNVAADDVSGSLLDLSSFAPGSSYDLTLSTLALSSEAFNAISTALGLVPGGYGDQGLTLAVGNFGSLSVSMNVAAIPYVPEPDQLWLWSVGLVGVGLAMRRRQRAAGTQSH
jgi:hypothetical protein